MLANQTQASKFPEYLQTSVKMPEYSASAQLKGNRDFLNSFRTNQQALYCRYFMILQAWHNKELSQQV